MKHRVLIAAILFAVLSNAGAVEISLGTTSGPVNMASTNVRSKAGRQVSVVAVIEGVGTLNPTTLSPIRQCAAEAAEQIGLRLIAAQPATSNTVFRRNFQICLAQRKLPADSVNYVELRVR